MTQDHVSSPASALRFGSAWTIGADQVGAAFVYGVIIIVPPLLLVTFATSSYAAGLILSSLLVAPLVSRGLPRLRLSLSRLTAASFVAAWSFVPLAANQGAPVRKIILSALLLVWLFLIAVLVNNELIRLRSESFKRVLIWYVVALSIIGWMSAAFHISPFNYAVDYGRPVFPFREPSHYALVAGPLFGALAAMSSGKVRVLLVVNIFLLAIVFPSTSLAIYAVGVSILVLPLRTLTFVLIPAAVLTFAFGNIDSSYFARRVDFGPDSESLTALVWMQGLSDGYDSFTESKGLGTGFQTMGYGPPGRVTQYIMQVYHTRLNREAGGFMAAKLIGELGIVGIALVLLLLRAMWKSGVFVRSMIGRSVDDRTAVAKLLAAHMVVALFVVELFVRAGGYFSPSFLLLGVALLHLNEHEPNHA